MRQQRLEEQISVHRSVPKSLACSDLLPESCPLMVLSSDETEATTLELPFSLVII